MQSIQKQRILPTLRFGLTCSLLLTFSPLARADNWSQWRGPAGTSVSLEKSLPTVWGENQKLVWKCKLPEWGTSTPAIWGDAIFLTCHKDDSLLLLRISKKTGKIVWTKEVGKGSAVRKVEKRTTQKFHRLHNLASPSPVTDGKTVVVHFGNGELAAYDFDGKQKWKRNLQKDYGFYSIWWGHANSPVVYKDTVISVSMQDSLADLRDTPVESYLVAHNLSDGRVKWKQLRKTEANSEECDAYTTPLLLDVAGETQLIVMGGNQLDAHNPADGKPIWYLPGLKGGRTVTGPTAGAGMVFTCRGMRGAMIAVVPKQRGKVEPDKIVWQFKKGTPDTCCPVVWEKLLFTVTDDGVARCFEAKSGELKWKHRLKGGYKASPLAADGRIYFLNTTGLCTVVSASPKFESLQENQLDDETIASPAVSDGMIFIRGRKNLYCVGEGSK